MISIQPSAKNKTTLNIQGNTSDRVGEYLNNILTANVSLYSIIKEYRNNVDITWEELKQVSLNNIPSITLHKNDEESAIQEKWWENIYNIDFKRISSAYLHQCAYNNVTLATIKDLIYGPKQKEKCVKKEFFTHKITEEDVKDIFTAKTVNEYTNVLNKLILYKSQVIKLNIITYNFKYLIKLAHNLKKEKFKQALVGKIYNTLASLQNTNSTWPKFYSFHTLVHKWIINYIPMQQKAALKLLKKSTDTPIDYYEKKGQLMRIDFDIILEYINYDARYLKYTNIYEISKLNNTHGELISNQITNHTPNHLLIYAGAKLIYKWKDDNDNKISTKIKALPTYAIHKYERALQKVFGIQMSQLPKIKETRVFRKRTI